MNAHESRGHINNTTYHSPNRKGKRIMFSCKKFIVEPKEQKYGTEEDEGEIELEWDEIMPHFNPHMLIRVQERN